MSEISSKNSCHFSSPAHEIYLQNGAHNGHNHQPLCRVEQSSSLAEILQSVDTGAVNNPIILGVLVCVAWYVHQAQGNTIRDHEPIDIQALKEMATCSAIVGVGVPTLYHTVGHRFGLPHFPGEATLGHASITLGACAGPYVRPIIDQASKYANIVKNIISKSSKINSSPKA